ncbi:oligosaccharyl transferase subunit OST3/OST6 family [Vararia minispora EC-137]|uniref:Oligosaccharyl transferase subunit OST3/OST6 family n=1 Tax=Vararia minispora EC-137 TaxID=1314806 RepID=A0ACB8QU15_9AGAM|nr:oligosaccharyl transferase subunit OST3/OST6 family [Vararia minispora EC-137]
MRLLSLLIAAPICFSLVTAQSPQEKLVQLASKNNGLIKLDKASYELLSAPGRTWSYSVLFTALDKKRRCSPCREFDPSWTAVAKAWQSAPTEKRDQHFFATADFDRVQDVFMKAGVQSAPVVFNYGASEGPRKVANPSNPVTYDFSNGFDAEPLAHQLSSHTPIAIPYRAPIRWGFLGMVAFSLLTAALTLRYLGFIIFSRWTWSAITVMTSLIMTSGFMFTKIRGMPMTAPNGEWIAGGFQNQYGQEVTVISSIYGFLAASFLMLALVAPRQTSQTKQTLQVYIYTGLIFFLFSVLISVFRIKNRGYPFKLLF